MKKKLNYALKLCNNEVLSEQERKELRELKKEIDAFVDSKRSNDMVVFAMGSIIIEDALKSKK